MDAELGPRELPLGEDKPDAYEDSSRYRLFQSAALLPGWCRCHLSLSYSLFLTDRDRVTGCAAEHRQVVVTSLFTEPEIQSNFRAYARSKTGLVKLKKAIASDGVLGQVLVSGLRQVLTACCDLSASTNSSV